MATDYIMWLLENREKALAARAEEVERERQGIEKERAKIRETADNLKEVGKEGAE
jgi:hypothetical protein